MSGQVPASGACPHDFSVVIGGPLHRLLCRLRLLKPSLGFLPRRLIALTLVAWVPLLLLTLHAGSATGGSLAIPFLWDVEAQVRFLLCLPLLLIAEVPVHRRLRTIVRTFLERRIVADVELPRFGALITDTRRLRDSAVVELLLLAGALSAGYWGWAERSAFVPATWFAEAGAGAVRLTPAGTWYAYVALAFFRFLLLRWYWRWALWFVFLLRLSRLRLRLNALHPDHAAGLGFLGNSVQAFWPFLAAHTLALSGYLGGRIWHAGESLPAFSLHIGAMLGVVLLLGFAPLLLFIPGIHRARRAGLAEFGVLAGIYARQFRAKWLQNIDPERDRLLGSPDVQSLADLANSYGIVRETKLLPFDRRVLIQVLLVSLLPLLPLVLTLIPLDQIGSRLLRILL